jgi:hypothetical protein
MPEDSIRRALLRAISAAVIFSAVLSAPQIHAQGTKAAVDDKQVEAFFSGIERDQQLAGQYASPAAEPAQAAAPRTLDKAALLTLEAQRAAALKADQEGRAVIAEEPPSPLKTTLLLLASLALLAIAATVLTLGIRELRKDARRRAHTYLRRIKHRGHAPAPDTHATVS